MIPAQSSLHRSQTGRFGRFAACLIGSVLISGMPVGDKVQADEPLTVTTQVDQPSNGNKVKSRGRRKHRSRRSQRASTADDSGIQLRLHGTFELDLGFGNVIRGEGNTSVELHPEHLEKLLGSLGKTSELGPSPQSDWTRLILTLPKTVETTAEILKRISDPQTQANLRQVEQLLRLLPGSNTQVDPRR